jgi:hypothetical protein
VALALRHRVDGFYLRLAHRRFDTLETYNDFIMRDHFASLDLFFDYYADLAEDLAGARFDRSRPTEVEVLEFCSRTQDAQVLVRFVGDDGRPLRPAASSWCAPTAGSSRRAPGGCAPEALSAGLRCEANCSPGVTVVHEKGNDSPRASAGTGADLGGISISSWRRRLAYVHFCPSWHGRCTNGGRT